MANASARLLSAALLSLCAWHAHAAQLTLTANQAALLEEMPGVLASAEVSIVEQARTEHFAMIYGARSNGARVTITLHRTPHQQTRITLIVTSDSPADEAFDTSLLAALAATQT